MTEEEEGLDEKKETAEEVERPLEWYWDTWPPCWTITILELSSGLTYSWSSDLVACSRASWLLVSLPDPPPLLPLLLLIMEDRLVDEVRLAGSGMRRSPDDTFRSPVSGRSLATLSNPVSKMRLEYTAEGVEGKSACNER